MREKRILIVVEIAREVELAVAEERERIEEGWQKVGQKLNTIRR